MIPFFFSFVDEANVTVLGCIRHIKTSFAASLNAWPFVTFVFLSFSISPSLFWIGICVDEKCPNTCVWRHPMHTENSRISQLGPEYWRRVSYHLQLCMNATRCVFSNYAYFRIVLDKQGDAAVEISFCHDFEEQTSCYRCSWRWRRLLLREKKPYPANAFISFLPFSYLFVFIYFVCSRCDVVYRAEHMCAYRARTCDRRNEKNETYNKRAGSAKNQAWYREAGSRSSEWRLNKLAVVWKTEHKWMNEIAAVKDRASQNCSIVCSQVGCARARIYDTLLHRKTSECDQSCAFIPTSVRLDAHTRKYERHRLIWRR